MAEQEKRKVISVHPDDVRRWNYDVNTPSVKKEPKAKVHPSDVRHYDYGGTRPTLQDRIDAFTIFAPACHNLGHATVRKEAAHGISQIEEFLKKEVPKK